MILRMDPRLRWLLPLIVLAGVGCANGPTCGLPLDATGRLVVYCDNPRDEGVCDEPGQQAHYESGAMGVQLVGGQRASCDVNDVVVCPAGTVGEAYCITDPEL